MRIYMMSILNISLQINNSDNLFISKMFIFILCKPNSDPLANWSLDGSLELLLNTHQVEFTILGQTKC